MALPRGGMDHAVSPVAPFEALQVRDHPRAPSHRNPTAENRPRGRSRSDARARPCPLDSSQAPWKGPALQQTAAAVKGAAVAWHLSRSLPIGLPAEDVMPPSCRPRRSGCCASGGSRPRRPGVDAPRPRLHP